MATCKTTEERFWSKVNFFGPSVTHVEGIGNCWLWTGASGPHGYGGFGVRANLHLRAHRYSWEWTYGPIPDGLLVLHRCDVRLCVRPDHLWVGTQRENLVDMIAKGRGPTGERNGAHTMPHRVPRGAGQRTAKLTDEKVREARWRRMAGDRVVDIAADMGVVPSLITGICLGYRWKHVT